MDNTKDMKPKAKVMQIPYKCRGCKGTTRFKVWPGGAIPQVINCPHCGMGYQVDKEEQLKNSIGMMVDLEAMDKASQELYERQQ